MEIKKRKCVSCNKKVLGNSNKSGYCGKCFRHSPQYLEYQRIKQNEYYKKNPNKRDEYYQRPEVRKRIKKYMKNYVEEHRERINELKRNWAKKQKEKNK